MKEFWRGVSFYLQTIRIEEIKAERAEGKEEKPENLRIFKSLKNFIKISCFIRKTFVDILNFLCWKYEWIFQFFMRVVNRMDSHSNLDEKSLTFFLVASFLGLLEMKISSFFPFSFHRELFPFPHDKTHFNSFYDFFLVSKVHASLATL